MDFLQAKFFTPTTGRTIDLLVVHSMESPEKPDTAEAVARYFHETVTRPSSAHYCSDINSDVQCVADKDVAYGAPGANHNGLHFELAGRASQTIGDWADPYSTAMLKRFAVHLLRPKAKQYGIPLVYIGPEGLKAGKRGVTTHAAVSLAFKRSTHTDPGANFPMSDVLAWASEPEGVDMTTAELDAYLASTKGQARLRLAVREEIRAGFGSKVSPDDGTVSSFSRFVVSGLRTLLDRTTPPTQ